MPTRTSPIVHGSAPHGHVGDLVAGRNERGSAEARSDDVPSVGRVIHRVPSSRWRVGLRQSLALLGALALCPIAALVIGGDADAPIARAEALIAAERLLGIYVEPAVHTWARAHPDLLMTASAFYVLAHVPVAGWALIWTWFLRRDRFALVRDTFLWTQGILVAIYLLVPTPPPRLVPGTGFADTLTGLWGREFADSAHVLQSPFAAVPSGHVAFALVASGVFARMGDMRWLRVFGWAYAPVVVAVTVVTANHLLFDAVAAACVVGCAYRLAAKACQTTSYRACASRKASKPSTPGPP